MTDRRPPGGIPQDGRLIALVPAAGRGLRAGGRENKLLQLLGDVPVIVHTAAALLAEPRVAEVHVLTAPAEQARFEALFADTERWARVRCRPLGGPERQDTVAAGVAALAADPPAGVLVHDGARPCCPPVLIGRVVDALGEAPAAAPVLPVVDTLRERGDGGARVVDRSRYWLTQTPQGFAWNLLRGAHEAAAAEGRTATDDAQLVEALGTAVALVPGARRNLKLTEAADLEFAAWLLAHPDWGC